MREIKFRAWDGFELAYEVHLDDKWAEGKTKDGCNIRIKYPKYSQYTGIKDKNGKEIYEGDICRYRWYINDNDIAEEITDKVEFTGGSFMFHMSPLWEWRETQKPWSMLLEILGNIYENPELLEEDG